MIEHIHSTQKDGGNSKSPQGEKRMINQDLLDILACPQCKGPVVLNEKGDGLVCDTCHLLYEIRDDIPVMLVDEAKSLDDIE